MKNLIIDERIREIEYIYLSKYFHIKKLPLSSDVYEEIAGHSDIFYCKIDDKIICAPNAKIVLDNFEKGNTQVKYSYPHDVPYNACQIGNKIIGSQYTDSTIKVDVFVKQGYTKCSIAVTSNHSCITTDKGIFERLKEIGIDVLYIEEDAIHLLDRNSNISHRKGFVGGASLIFDNKFVLFGDSYQLKNREKVMKHLKKYNLELVDFKGLDIYDYGSGIFWSER